MDSIITDRRRRSKPRYEENREEEQKTLNKKTRKKKKKKNTCEITTAKTKLGKVLILGFVAVGNTRKIMGRKRKQKPKRN